MWKALPFSVNFHTPPTSLDIARWRPDFIDVDRFCFAGDGLYSAVRYRSPSLYMKTSELAQSIYVDALVRWAEGLRFLDRSMAADRRRHHRRRRHGWWSRSAGVSKLFLWDPEYSKLMQVPVHDYQPPDLDTICFHNLWLTETTTPPCPAGVLRRCGDLPLSLLSAAISQPPRGFHGSPPLLGARAAPSRCRTRPTSVHAQNAISFFAARKAPFNCGSRWTTRSSRRI
jgi:hypothetical protein